MSDIEENKYEIEGKAYSEDELYKIGRLHFPKRYWIKRGTGIALWVVGFDYGISLPFSIYAVIRYGGAAAVIGCILLLLPFVSFLIAGTIVFILSFKPEAREVYVEYGKRYLEKAELRGKRAERNQEAYKLKQRARLKKLLDKGVLTQEEYDNKVKELQ